MTIVRLSQDMPNPLPYALEKENVPKGADPNPQFDTPPMPDNLEANEGNQPGAS